MSRRARLAPFAAAAALLALAGCGRKEKPKPPPKAPPPVVQGPPGVLAYASQGRIFRMRKGEAPEQVAAGPAWFPALNPDGSLVAYWEDHGPSMRLVVLNTVSRAVSVVGDFASVGPLGRSLNLHNAPCWDAKRDRVYFADGRQIWEADADGSNLATVYEHKAGGCYGVTVSPDGFSFAFVSVTEKDQNLWTYSAMTRRAQAVTDYSRKDGMVGAPAWCPAEARIAYVLYKADESNVWLVPAEGGQAQELTKEGRTNSPSWEPAGKVLAVSSGSQAAYAWQVALMNAAEGRFIQQISNAAAGAYSPSLVGAW